MGYSATCGKCDGLGKIWAFGHVDNGKCFWCHGSGKLTFKGAAPTAIDTARQRASWEFHIVAEAVANGNLDRARFYAKGVAEQLFIAGTKNALSILNGPVYDSNDRVIPRAACRKAAEIVIEIGKELQSK